MDVTYHDVSPRTPGTRRQNPRAAGGAITRRGAATACVIGWSAFWVFGFLALSSGFDFDDASVLIEIVVAAMGFGVGMWAYLRLCADSPSLARGRVPESPEVHLPPEL